MRAMLLAAGKGTRLKPYTNDKPKCLMPIKGKPLLDIWINKLCNVGVKNFFINTHYLHEQVNEFVSRNELKEKIQLSHELELLGTAGTLLNNLNFFKEEDSFFIHADNYCEDNLEDFILAHLNRPKECLMTMMTFRTDDIESSGIVKVDDYGIVRNYYEKEKNAEGNLANGAVFIFSKEFISFLKAEHYKGEDFSKDILSKLINQIYTYETKELFIDIGSVKNYQSVT
tara:strand:+ start:1233 stop:1916 length:684 start_codon:yes stop_codon:yes gene_type:complete